MSDCASLNQRNRHRKPAIDPVDVESRDLHAKRGFSLRYDAISGIRGRITEPAIARVATATGSLKRCGPALPGLTQTVPFLVSILGRCECPEMTTSNPDAAGSSVISFRLCTT